MHRYSPYSKTPPQPIQQQNNELEKNLKNWIQIAKTQPNELEQLVMKHIPYQNGNYTTQVAIEWGLDLFGSNKTTGTTTTTQQSNASPTSKGGYHSSNRYTSSSDGPHQTTQSRTTEEEDYLQQMFVQNILIFYNTAYLQSHQ